MNGHRPRKHLGQHFLRDRRVIDRIVARFAPQPDDRVVEIGPGLGALTRRLQACLPVLHVIEIDRDLAARLRQEDGAGGRLRVHGADALHFDFCALAAGPHSLRVIGNLPYNISTPLLFHLLAQQHCIRDMCLMLQQEVVERMCAGPGDAAYGRLAVMVQWRCRVERLFTVPPGAFAPPPKVHSAVVRLVPHREPPVVVHDPEAFARVVRAAFGQRRKTLRNALRPLADPSQIAAAGVDPGARAETLTLEQFARLSNTVANDGR